MIDFTNSSHIKLVVYDLDGTIIDTAPIVLNLLNDMRQEFKKKPIEKSSLIPWLSLGGEDLIRNALGIHESQIKGALGNFRKRYSVVHTPSECLYPEIRETLASLKSRSVNVAICTNKPRHLAEKSLQDTKIDGFIDFMCAGDDLVTKKPSRENLESCLKKFDVSNSEMIYVGDSSVDQKLAESCGVKFYFFTKGYNDCVDVDKVKFSIETHGLILEEIFGVLV